MADKGDGLGEVVEGRYQACDMGSCRFLDTGTTKMCLSLESCFRDGIQRLFCSHWTEICVDVEFPLPFQS